jgi:hypothetical protein
MENSLRIGTNQKLSGNTAGQSNSYTKILSKESSHLNLHLTCC